MLSTCYLLMLQVRAGPLRAARPAGVPGVHVLHHLQLHQQHRQRQELQWQLRWQPQWEFDKYRNGEGGPWKISTNLKNIIYSVVLSSDHDALFCTRTESMQSHAKLIGNWFFWHPLQLLMMSNVIIFWFIEFYLVIKHENMTNYVLLHVNNLRKSDFVNSKWQDLSIINQM